MVRCCCGFGHPASQACGSLARVDGAIAPCVGSDGSPGARLRWHRARHAGHRALPVDDSAGPRELASGGRSRARGSRRAAAAVSGPPTSDATLFRDEDTLVEPTAPGDPESPLRWRAWSARTLAVALEGLGHRMSHTVVAELLRDLGYSFQGNVKTRRAASILDRDAQFRYIARRVRVPQGAAAAISVVTKKKELVGDFKNARRKWLWTTMPHRVRVDDFVVPAPPTRRKGHPGRG